MNFIVNCMNLIEPKRKKCKTVSQRQAMFHYKLPIGSKFIAVCQKTLCNVLGVTQKRIQIIQNKIKSESQKIDFTNKQEICDNLLETINDEIYLQIKENVNSYSHHDSVITSLLESDHELLDTKMYQLFNEKYPEIQISREIYNDILRETYCTDLNENELSEDVDDPINDRLIDNNLTMVKIEEECKLF